MLPTVRFSVSLSTKSFKECRNKIIINSIQRATSQYNFFIIPNHRIPVSPLLQTLHVQTQFEDPSSGRPMKRKTNSSFVLKHNRDMTMNNGQSIHHGKRNTKCQIYSSIDKQNECHKGNICATGKFSDKQELQIILFCQKEKAEISWVDSNE